MTAGVVAVAGCTVGGWRLHGSRSKSCGTAGRAVSLSGWPCCVAVGCVLVVVVAWMMTRCLFGMSMVFKSDVCCVCQV